MPQSDNMATEESIKEIDNGVQAMDMNTDRSEQNDNANGRDEMTDFSGLPSILIVTNVDESVYDSADTRVIT